MLHDHQISADYLYGIFEILESMGKSPIDLCEELGIVIPKSKTVSMALIEKLVHYFRDTLDIPYVGLLLGMKNGSASHGMLGYAAKSCRTLNDAIQVDAQYMATRISGITFSYKVVGDTTEVSIFVDESIEHLIQFVVELIYGSLISFFRELFPNEKLNAYVKVNYSASRGVMPYKTITKVAWDFDQDRNVFIVPSNILTLVLPTYDNQLKELMINRCDSEVIAQAKDNSLSANVRMLLKNNLASAPTVGEVAQHFQINERTLKRKLLVEGESYRNILIELRVAKATQLLVETDMSVDDIAHQIGYSSPNTFKRLFKKWTNTTPGSIRKPTPPK